MNGHIRCYEVPCFAGKAQSQYCYSYSLLIKLIGPYLKLNSNIIYVWSDYQKSIWQHSVSIEMFAPDKRWGWKGQPIMLGFGTVIPPMKRQTDWGLINSYGHNPPPNSAELSALEFCVGVRLQTIIMGHRF